MKRLNHLLLFLATLGGLTHKAVEDSWARELLEKTATVNGPIYVTLQKDAGAVIRAGRITAGLGEAKVMPIFGLDPTKPEDLQKYVDIESDKVKVALTVDSLTALAKAYKADPISLAVQIIDAQQGVDPNAVDPNATPTPNPNPNPDPNANPQKSTETLMAKLEKKLDSEEKAQLNAILLKSQQTKTPGATEIVQKSADQEKLEKRAELSKAIVGLKEDARENLEKGGIITATDFANGGVLTAAQSDTFFEIAQPQMQLLNKVQVIRMSSKKQKVPTIGVNQRTARRFAPRASIADSDNVQVVGLEKELECRDIDLVYSISEEIMLNGSMNPPDLENKVHSVLSMNYTYQAEDLGINGTTDTYASTFLSLGTGWIKLMQNRSIDNTGTGGTDDRWRIVDASVLSITTVSGMLDKILSTLVANKPVNANNQQNVFLMSPADWETFEKERIADRKSDDVLIDGAKGTYRGHPIFVASAMPTGYYLYTPLINLIFAYVNVGSSGVRMRRFENTKALDIMMSIAVDFDLVDENACVLGQP